MSAIQDAASTVDDIVVGTAVGTTVCTEMGAVTDNWECFKEPDGQEGPVLAQVSSSSFPDEAVAETSVPGPPDS